jgi:hypothetical protein
MKCGTDHRNIRAFRKLRAPALASVFALFPLKFAGFADSWVSRFLRGAVGGIPETVVDGQTGLLVESGNVDAIAASLRRMLTDEKLRQRMGTAGRARVLKHFTWQAVSEHIRQVYFGER